MGRDRSIQPGWVCRYGRSTRSGCQVKAAVRPGHSCPQALCIAVPCGFETPLDGTLLAFANSLFATDCGPGQRPEPPPFRSAPCTNRSVSGWLSRLRPRPGPPARRRRPLKEAEDRDSPHARAQERLWTAPGPPPPWSGSTVPTALLIGCDLQPPRRRQIHPVIPQPSDQTRLCLRRGGQGWRPPAFDADTYKQYNTVGRCINGGKRWRGLAHKPTNSRSLAVGSSFANRPSEKDRWPIPFRSCGGVQGTRITDAPSCRGWCLHAARIRATSHGW